ELNWLLHIIFPVASSIAIIVVCYKSVVPLPAWPVNLAPFITAGWVVLGLIVVVVLSRSGRAAWLTRAGDVLATSDAGPAEAAARQAAARRAAAGRGGGAPWAGPRRGPPASPSWPSEIWTPAPAARSGTSPTPTCPGRTGTARSRGMSRCSSSTCPAATP